MSLSMLTSRADNKFVYRGPPRRSRSSFFTRRGRNRRNQVIPTALELQEQQPTYTDSGKLDHSFHPNDPTSLDDVCNRLKRNQLKTLKLGFHECNFLVHKRCAKKIEEALRFNTSLTTVSIGWHHPCREALLLVIRAIARYTRLEHLQLILDDYLPENLLRTLLLKQSETLISIDLQSLHVRRRTINRRWCCDQLEKPQATASWHDSTSNCDHCVVSRALVDVHTTAYLPRLTQLYLQDVGLHDGHAVMLADYLHIRGGVQVLSVRNNRALRAHGVAVLCQAPVLETLDLSLCDMNPVTAAALAPALAGRHFGTLPQLILSGNYRMGPAALKALTGPVPRRHVRTMNLSYCDITDSRAVLVLESLKQSQLQNLIVRGSHVANDKALRALLALLRYRDSPLRTLRMDDPQRPMGFSVTQLRQITAALAENYELEEFVVDAACTEAEWEEIWSEMQFYLRLNKCGRRILLRKDQVRASSSGGSTSKWSRDQLLPSAAAAAHADTSVNELDLEWIQVLSRTEAQNDMDMLYWMVRNSADRF